MVVRSPQVAGEIPLCVLRHCDQGIQADKAMDCLISPDSGAMNHKIPTHDRDESAFIDIAYIYVTLEIYFLRNSKPMC